MYERVCLPQVVRRQPRARVAKMLPAVRWTLGYPLLLPMWWIAILGWYLMFGLLVVPWRLLRRGERRDRPCGKPSTARRDRPSEKPRASEP